MNADDILYLAIGVAMFLITLAFVRERGDGEARPGGRP